MRKSLCFREQEVDSPGPSPLPVCPYALQKISSEQKTPFPDSLEEKPYFTEERTRLLLLGVLPNFFSGVMARMIRGFPCLISTLAFLKLTSSLRSSEFFRMN